MKKSILATAAVALVFLVPTSPAAAAAPFKLVVQTQNKTKRIKVAKVLRVNAICSVNCRLKARFKLFTPVGSDTVKGGRTLPALTTWHTGMILTSTGRNALKANTASSRLAVHITATDPATGKTVTRNKTYRFYK